MLLPICSKTYCPYCIKAKKALAEFLQPSDMEVVEVSGLVVEQHYCRR